MKILMISSWYPSNEDTTDGSFVHEQAKLLTNNGHEVVVIKPNLSSSARETWKKRKVKKRKYEYEAISVYEVNVNVWLPKMKRHYYRKLINECLKLLQQEKITPDIIHSHSILSGGIVGASLSEMTKLPLVHTEHSSGIIFFPEQYDETDEHYFKLLSEQAKKIIFVSSFSMIKSLPFFNNRADKSVVISNVVDDTFFQYELKQTDKKNTAIAIGDFSERKNQLFLLDVWNQVKQFRNDAILILAGNGFENSTFKGKVADLKLDQNIVLFPRLNREGVKSQIADSCMLLSAAKAETFGLTVAEALALGKPVVASDSGGPSDIISNGDGFIVAQNDVNEFVKSIITIFEGNHDTPEIIRNRCEHRFGSDTIYEKLNRIYVEILN